MTRIPDLDFPPKVPIMARGRIRLILLGLTGIFVSLYDRFFSPKCVQTPRRALLHAAKWGFHCSATSSEELEVFEWSGEVICREMSQRGGYITKSRREELGVLVDEVALGC